MGREQTGTNGFLWDSHAQPLVLERDRPGDLSASEVILFEVGKGRILLGQRARDGAVGGVERLDVVQIAELRGQGARDPRAAEREQVHPEHLSELWRHRAGEVVVVHLEVEEACELGKLGRDGA